MAAARAFSSGAYWGIGENAGLNSAALYEALPVDKQRTGESKQYSFDAEVSRELGALPGGPIGVAFGVEARHEENNLLFYDDLGDYIGRSPSAYGAKRDICATFGEIVVPMFKELNAARHYDNYSDVGDSTMPKIGAKWKPLSNFALRRSYSPGLRDSSSKTVRTRLQLPVVPPCVTVRVAPVCPRTDCTRPRSMPTARVSRRPSCSMATKIRGLRSPRAGPWARSGMSPASRA